VRWKWCVLALLLLSPAARAGEHKTVLVLYATTRLLPASVEADAGFREVLAQASSAARPIEVYAEFLDLPRFGGAEFLRTFTTFLREKYRSSPPDVLVGAGSDAVDLLVRHRAELFPGKPILYIGSTRALIDPLRPLPPDVVGVPVVYDSAGTIEQALRWHPRARHLVIVTGAADADREQTQRMKDELARFADRVSIEWLSELPAAEVAKRVAALPPDTVVFTPGWFADGAGRLFAPREAAALIAGAANAPVYGPYNTFIGTGIVGGVVPSYGDMGRQGAELVVELLDGVAPAALHLPEAAPTHLEIDWRQAQRWGVAEEDVPATAVVRFREPTFWQAYRNVALAGIAVMALQSALIAALLFERRRRQRTAAALDESEQRMGLAARAAALSTWSWEFAREPPSGLDSPIAADRGEVEKAARDALARREELSVEYRVERRGGELRWLRAYGRADEHAGGARLLGVSRDVTEQKRAELAAEQDRAALSQMSRVSMLGQLSASIAHQLNQPLAAILANAEAARQLLAREEIDRAELREICDDIIGAEDRAAAVIQRLSALFRRGEIQFQPVDVNELLRETLELVRSELVMRHVAVSSELAPDLPEIEGGRVQLQQVFLNLMMNAADAMQETKESERRLTVRTEAKDGEIQIAVRDTGSGIVARDVAHVFDPFWTTKLAGMGMGLAICRSIVDSHRGALTAQNNPDRGATFRVALPAPAR